MPSLYTKCKLCSTWFQQNGTTCHIAAQTMELLRQTFGACIIAHGSALVWLLRSSNLMVSNFSLHGYSKSRVYTTKLRHLDELKDQIRAKMSQIPKSMMEDMYNNCVCRLRSYLATDNKCLTNVIF